MVGILSVVRDLVGRGSAGGPPVDPGAVLHGTESYPGAISIRERLTDWERSCTLGSTAIS
jgi:hypothetical protein